MHCDRGVHEVCAVPVGHPANWKRVNQLELELFFSKGYFFARRSVPDYFTPIEWSLLLSQCDELDTLIIQTADHIAE